MNFPVLQQARNNYKTNNINMREKVERNIFEIIYHINIVKSFGQRENFIEYLYKVRCKCKKICMQLYLDDGYM